MDYWDNIDVGNPSLNHSEGFFNIKHVLQEIVVDNIVSGTFKNVEKIYIPVKAVSPNCNKENTGPVQQNERIKKSSGQISPSTITIGTKKNNSNNQTKATIKVTTNLLQNKPQAKREIQTKISAIQKLKKYDKPKLVPKQVKSSFQKPTKTYHAPKLGQTFQVARHTVSSYPLNKTKANIETTSHTQLDKFVQKPIHRKTMAEMSTRMQSYTQLYAQRKENLIKKMSEYDNNNRIFHSNPIPLQLMRPSNVAVVTKTKRRPTETAKKDPKSVKQNVKQITLQLTGKTDTNQHRFVAKKAKVLELPPFQPKKIPKDQIKIAVFNFRMGDRCNKRKEFDEIVKKRQTEKTNQIQGLKKQQLEADTKLLRKQTEFKAKPNPFKKQISAK